MKRPINPLARSRFRTPSRFSRLLLTASVLTLFLFVWPCPAATLAPNAADSGQCIAIVRVLEQQHYTGKKLDTTMSGQIFDRYIKSLDPLHHVFTQEDMDEFEPLRFIMHRAAKRGDLGPAYEIFSRYQARSRQRLTYILDRIKTWPTTIDFTRDDTMVIDEKLRKFVPRLSDLEHLWQQELKNHIISLKLDDMDDAKISETLEKTYSTRLVRLDQYYPRDVFQLFMNAVTTSFDPHTQYFPPRVSEEFDINMRLSLEGIGAVLQTEYEYTKVVRLIPKGPADKSHLLLPGDKIIGVGQGRDGEIKDTIGQRIDDVVKLIRGPKDSFVRLKIIPAKNANTTSTISIRRDEVKLEEQSAQKKTVSVPCGDRTCKLGIIEIPNFYIDFEAYHRGDADYKSTTHDVRKLLAELEQEHIDGLIIDLRDNGGGSLKEASELTGLFLTFGPTVQIRSKYRVTRLYDEDPSIAYQGPLVVLINRMSASASEIFAGAIKDYNRGLIVGARSFGKGTVQELAPLGPGRLKMTSAKFYRVSGQSTQHRGVIPDIEFPKIYRVEETGESSLDGALLWDRINPTRYSAYTSLAPMFSELTRNYTQRSDKAPGMVYLQKWIALANEMGEQQRLSLNLAAREKADTDMTQKELVLENDYRTKIGEPPLKSLDDSEPRIKAFKEILMKQTEYITADFIRLSRRQGYAW